MSIPSHPAGPLLHHGTLAFPVHCLDCLSSAVAPCCDDILKESIFRQFLSCHSGKQSSSGLPPPKIDKRTQLRSALESTRPILPHASDWSLSLHAYCYVDRPTCTTATAQSWTEYAALTPRARPHRPKRNPASLVLQNPERHHRALHIYQSAPSKPERLAHSSRDASDYLSYCSTRFDTDTHYIFTTTTTTTNHHVLLLQLRARLPRPLQPPRRPLRFLHHARSAIYPQQQHKLHVLRQQPGIGRLLGNDLVIRIACSSLQQRPVAEKVNLSSKSTLGHDSTT